MRDNFFVLLPKDLSRYRRTDQYSDEIVINWGGKQHSSGGYDVGNILFNRIISKLNDIRKDINNKSEK